MEFVGERVIAITGTKGKSTTSSVVAHILNGCGCETQIVGNIGYPALECLLSDDGKKMYVYEMSSFQTEFLQSGPKIGVILNLFEEHLNNYIDYQAYQESKLQMFKAKVKHPKEQLLIYGCDNDVLVNKIKDLRKSSEDRQYFTFGHSQKNKMSDPGYFIEDQEIIKVDKDGSKEIIVSTDFSRHLVGEHNLLNSMVAFIVADKLREDGKLSARRIDILNLLASFTGLAHRLENVGTYREIHFYNDSISTIPEASKKAVEAIENIGTLIIGGFDRMIDYSEFAAYLDELKDVTIICLPTTGHKVCDMMLHQEKCIKVEDMTQAVEMAYRYTKAGCACILSPAASSYNQYKNFEERGDHFVECIKKGEITNS
jgi:UDP-N-acetylmuramoylalanine--D-glutamate ligase